MQHPRATLHAPKLRRRAAGRRATLAHPPAGAAHSRARRPPLRRRCVPPACAPVSDFAHWHDGIGHDLDGLAALPPAARDPVARALVPPAGAHDVAALAVLDTPVAHDALRTAARSGSLDVRLAVLHHAPAVLDESARTALVLQAISQARPFAGLSATLDAILAHHPPAIVDALHDALHAAPGEVAYHYAAILSVLRGAVASEYDMTLRPLWLALHTDDPVARRDAVRSLLAHLDATCAP